MCYLRVYVFFEAYSQFTLQRVEEEWLRQSCQDPDFYSNMRQHTDLCALVSIYFYHCHHADVLSLRPEFLRSCCFVVGGAQWETVGSPLFTQHHVHHVARMWSKVKVFLSLSSSCSLFTSHTPVCGALVVIFFRVWHLGSVTVCVWPLRPCIEYINDLVLRGIAWPVAIVACLFVVTVPSIISSMAGKSMWQALDSRARNTPADTYTRLHKMHEPNAPFYTTTTLQTDCYTDHDHREEEEIGGFENNGEVGMVLRGGHTPSYGTDMSVYPRRRRDHPMI